MKVVSLLTILFVSLSASAAQFKTVVETKTQKNPEYKQKVKYPLFFAGTSVPGAAAINANLKNSLLQFACDADDFAYAVENNLSFLSYTALARVVALNSDYVGVEVFTDESCGGIYPNFDTSNLTYDAQTGDLISMEEQFPEELAPTEEELIDLISKNISNRADMEEYGCFDEDGTIQEGFLQSVGIEGLAKGKTVVLRSSPPHVIAACEFEARVPYSKIQKYLAKNSILHKWLK